MPSATLRLTTNSSWQKVKCNKFYFLSNSSHIWSKAKWTKQTLFFPVQMLHSSYQSASLMFVPCIAWLGITDQHYTLIITPLFINQAPTCFGTYVPSSWSVLYPCEFLVSPHWLRHRDVPLYCKHWWAVWTSCCSFMRYFVQLSACSKKVTHETTTSGAHRPPTFTVQGTSWCNNHFRLSSNSQGERTLPEDGT
jgi:hypothetical protein